MTAYDEHVTSRASRALLRLASSIHLKAEADGGALVIDDETLTAARINKSAHILFQALDRPRTLGDLVSIFAETARCPVSEAFTPVARLVGEAVHLGWLEVQEGSGQTGLPR